MEHRIIAVNGKRVSDFLKIKIDDETKLVEGNNEIIDNFLIKYRKYLLSNKIEDIKEFYNLTGLMLTHVYNVSDTRQHIFSMNNISRFDTTTNAFSKPIYITQILVITEGSDNNDNSYYSQVFWKNEKEKQLGNNIRYTMSCICSNIKNKINLIENKYDPDTFKKFNKNNIKDIYLTSLNNLCILFNNGDLWVDNRLYATNVDTIWHQDSYNSYIIYKDNKLEHLESEFPFSNIRKYKKVLYNNSILATLKNKKLGLTIIVDLPDTSVMTTILDVDDIEINKRMLEIIVGDEKIRIPSWYNTIVVDRR